MYLKEELGKDGPNFTTKAIFIAHITKNLSLSFF